jgi:hypothetical protein
VKQQIQLRRREALSASIYLPNSRRCCSGCTPAAACVAQELERGVKGMLPWSQLAVSKKR